MLDDKLKKLHWIEKWEPRGEGCWFLTQYSMKVIYCMKISCQVKSKSPTQDIANQTFQVKENRYK